MYKKDFKVESLPRPIPPRVVVRRPWIRQGGIAGAGIDPDCAILASNEFFRGEDPACTVLDCEDGNPIELES